MGHSLIWVKLKNNWCLLILKGDMTGVDCWSERESLVKNQYIVKTIDQIGQRGGLLSSKEDAQINGQI